MSRFRTSVAVLYNAPTLAPDHPSYRSEADVVDVASQIAAILERAGFEAWNQPAAPPLADLVAELSGTAPDVVFNLIEGFGGRSGGEAYVTGLLELLRLPYTGCPPDAQSLCHQKSRTKAVLRGNGLPTAAYVVVSGTRPFEVPFEGPFFVKPDAEDAGLGVDQASVVEDRNGLIRRVRELQTAFGPDVLIEPFLPGAEFNVGVLSLPEPMPLPVAEVAYRKQSTFLPILTYAAKWNEGSEEDLASPVRCPAVIDDDLSEQLRRLAVEAVLATGCRDYARVDMRLDAAGRPMILEVNPNPDIGPTAGWARALRASGRDYDETIVALTRQALDRGA